MPNSGNSGRRSPRSQREHKLQISVAFSRAQLDWLSGEANRRAISVAEYVRRLVDGNMLGDNTMSRGVDWQPMTLPDIKSVVQLGSATEYDAYKTALAHGDYELAQEIRDGSGRGD